MTNCTFATRLKPRVDLRLDAQLLAILEDVALEHQTTKTAVLEDALRHYFSEERDYALEDRVMKRMDKFETRMGRLEWKTNLSIEIMSHYMQYWLTRTDPMPRVPTRRSSGPWLPAVQLLHGPGLAEDENKADAFARVAALAGGEAGLIRHHGADPA
jgi:hypothetical protein